MPKSGLFLVACSLLTVAGCADATAPVETLPVSIAAQVMGDGEGGSLPSHASGRLRSILISGGHGLNCGVQQATGQASRRGEALRIKLEFRPLDSCPFAPTVLKYEAIVDRVPPGWYEVEVTQSYWPEPASVVLRQRIFVSGP